jgi:hypothetical protein
MVTGKLQWSTMTFSCLQIIIIKLNIHIPSFPLDYLSHEAIGSDKLIYVCHGELESLYGTVKVASKIALNVSYEKSRKTLRISKNTKPH